MEGRKDGTEEPKNKQKTKKTPKGKHIKRKQHKK